MPDPLGSLVYWSLCPWRHNLPLSSGFESRILRIIGFHGWYNSNIVGANGIRPPMIQVHFPIIGMTCSTVRLPNSIMFQYKFTRFHLVLNQDLQDFQDCRGRLRFGCKGLFVDYVFFHTSFRRCVTHRREALQWKQHVLITFPPKPTTL